MDRRDLTVQMETILDDYSDEVKAVANEAFESVAKKALVRLKQTSPRSKGRRGGRYARGWALKRERVSGNVLTATIYNRARPGLTHLLEHGHVTRNGHGTYRRTPAHPHIKAVEQWASTALPAEIERRLK